MTAEGAGPWQPSPGAGCEDESVGERSCLKNSLLSVFEMFFFFKKLEYLCHTFGKLNDFKLQL